MNALPKIAVGVCTRGRPDGLAALLDSCTRLRFPEGFRPVFVIVENDAAKSLQTLIGDFAGRVGAAEVVYEIEPRLGIPFARNRVLDLVLERNCELLAFVDDDEVVDTEWLRGLHGELQARDLQLVGGPVRILPAPAGAGWVERAIWRGLVTRYAGLEAAALRRHENGTDQRVSIVTSSWLAKLEFIRDQGLRFDEGLGFSGGSDTRFFRQFGACKGRSGWAPKAIVRETWPLSRLRPGYQYRRGRDQAISHFHNRHAAVTPGVAVQSFFFVAGKLLAAAVLIPLAVLDGGRSSVRALRALGFAVGRTRALCGGKSRHYVKVQA
jgi:succinoglycan biosynthesis protein ExoM